jgi:hypothetical protein
MLKSFRKSLRGSSEEVAVEQQEGSVVVVLAEARLEYLMAPAALVVTGTPLHSVAAQRSGEILRE